MPLFRINKRKLTALTDGALAALALAATVGMTWIGLRGTDRAITVSTEPKVTTVIEQEIPEDTFVIAVDPGHGGFDGGAEGSTTGVAEAGLNLEVSRMLADELTSRGYYVIMTREDDGALADTKSADMRLRSEIMRLEPVDLVISVHMNKFGDSQVSGPMVFYMKGSDKGKALAELVISSICEATGRQPRHANPEDLFVLREPTAPSVLVECGFLSNPDDERLLCDGEYRKLLARAIADGVDDYVSSLSVSQGG